MIFRSLSFRLTLYSCLLTYLLLLGCWGLLYLSVERELFFKDQETVSDRLETIQNLLNLEPNQPVRLTRRVEQEWPKKSFEHIYVRVSDPNGTLITETPGLDEKYEHILEILPKHAENIGKINKLSNAKVDGRIFGVGSFIVPVRTSWGEDRVLVQMALERTSEEVLLSTLRSALIYLLAFGFVGSLLSGRFVVIKALKSIRKIAETAQKVSSGGLKERVNPSDLPMEFVDFVNTLNDMLERLEESFERLSRFSADMAHELRTPLNNLLGSLEVSLSKERSNEEYQMLLASNIEECGRLKRIIDSLLFIARAQQPIKEIQKQTFDLVEELSAIISFYEVSAERRSISIKLNSEQRIAIHAERTLLQRAIGNLLSNAIRLAPEGSEIIVNAKEENKSVVISVEDSGPGIPADLLPFVGERFFRAEESRSQTSGGNGLGLSIVKSIVEIHGGKMAVESHVGSGTTFYLIFLAED